MPSTASGYVATRATKSGIRFTAYVYDESRRAVSAGTYASREEAEAAVEAGYYPRGNAGGGANRFMTYADYVNQVWLPSTREASTRKGYDSIMRIHVLPLMGHLRLCDILRPEIERTLELLRQAGKSDAIIDRSKTLISASLSPIVRSGVLPYNPCSGIQVKKPARRKYKLILPEEMKAILVEMERQYGLGARLYASFIIESGCRYGEASEVRPKDIDWRTGTVIISRAVSDIGAKHNPHGTGRFYVKDTKGHHERFTGVTRELLAELEAWVKDNGISDDSLMFSHALVAPHYSARKVMPEVDLEEDYGMTAPNDRGYSYRHGTTTAYQAGRCRCDYCKAAIRQYRREYRKARGLRLLDPADRVNLTGHLPKDAWRAMWRSVVKESVKTWTPRPAHEMRHANATWLLKGGMDLHTVQSRLGHSSITTTEIYLHNLEAMDSKANEVMAGFLK